MNQIVSQYFSNIVSVSDEKINLAEAALHIGMLEYPDLSVPDYQSRLDAMAAELKHRFPTNSSAESLISTINEYLFKNLGFSGNLRNFNDPGNSYLNQVLDRKLGIPISLSLVYIEVGERLGLSLHGVSFPGHFLVRFDYEGKRFIIDPFSAGLVLDDAELLQRLQHFSEYRRSDWTLQDLLKPAKKREILARMLRNLKNIYLDVDDFHHALAPATLLLILEPDSADGLRDRGLIYQGLDCYRAASDDFQRYLQLYPTTMDRQIVQSRLADLQGQISRLH